MTGSDRFSRAEPIADAVLWDGYALYPYRADAAKNRLRFNWGVVGPAEDDSMASTVLVGPDADRLDVRVRHLHLVARSDGWDEAVPVSHDASAGMAELLAYPCRFPLSVPEEAEAGDDGLARRRHAIEAELTLSAEQVGDAVAVRIQIDNPTVVRGQADRPDRSAGLLVSLVGCHAMVATDGDHFVSLLEPPDDLAPTIERLHQHRAWPVLVGPAPAKDLMLASPVILYDYPSIAPESAGDFHDGTEIDEMLALRVHTLTDEEKAQARALDPRTKAIIDRHDVLEPTTMSRLHGGVRPAEPSIGERPGVPVEGGGGSEPVDPQPGWSDAGPARALVGGRWIEPGAKVRLRPGRRADVHDMFLVGRRATVADIVHDVDGGIHVAVTVDDDPAADLFREQRRFLYFAPDELSMESGYG